MRAFITSEFRTKVAFQTDGEVALFRALAMSIVAHTRSVFVDETHGGNVCNVSFTSVIGSSETCEIADLLIITINRFDARLRATFWQAKKQQRSRWLRLAHSKTQLDFNGQFNQWDLLSRRPAIVGIGRFAPPPDLLTSFASPSIGTFGVFYEENGIVELAHSIAACVGCPSPTSKHPRLAVNGHLRPYYLDGSEAICLMDLESFLDALFASQIGALIDPAVNAHRWLISKVRAKIISANPAADLTSLDGFLGNVDAEIAEVDPLVGLSLLLVNI